MEECDEDRKDWTRTAAEREYMASEVRVLYHMRRSVSPLSRIMSRQSTGAAVASRRRHVSSSTASMCRTLVLLPSILTRRVSRVVRCSARSADAAVNISGATSARSRPVTGNVARICTTFATVCAVPSTSIRRYQPGVIDDQRGCTETYWCCCRAPRHLD